jgi:hypothetical protein
MILFNLICATRSYSIQTARRTSIRSTLHRTAPAHHSVSYLLSSTSSSTGSEWKKYLIEFRGGSASLRLLEFHESIRSVLEQRRAQLNLGSMADVDALIYSGLFSLTPVVNDTLSDTPVAAYVKLPSEEIAKLIAERCCLVRSIIEVWGDSGNGGESDTDTDIEELKR